MELNGKIYFSIVFLIGFIMMLSMASAATLSPVKQNSCTQLKQTCDNCSFVNITNINSPTSQQLYKDVVMAKAGTRYNYTFCNTSVMGIYTYDTLGDLNGVLTSEPVTFEVTADGLPYQQFPIQIVILIAGFAMIFIGLYVKEIQMITFFGAIIVIVMGVLTLFPGYSYINYTNLIGLAIGSISIGTGFYFLFHDFMINSEKRDEYYEEDDGDDNN